MKILVFADVHYYGGNMETAIFSRTKKLVQYALPMLDALREKVCAACAPDICVNLGDIIHHSGYPEPRRRCAGSCHDGGKAAGVSLSVLFASG